MREKYEFEYVGWCGSGSLNFLGGVLVDSASLCHIAIGF